MSQENTPRPGTPIPLGPAVEAQQPMYARNPCVPRRQDSGVQVQEVVVEGTFSIRPQTALAQAQATIGVALPTVIPGRNTNYAQADNDPDATIVPQTALQRALGSIAAGRPTDILPPARPPTVEEQADGSMPHIPGVTRPLAPRRQSAQRAVRGRTSGRPPW